MLDSLKKHCTTLNMLCCLQSTRNHKIFTKKYNTSSKFAHYITIEFGGKKIKSISGRHNDRWFPKRHSIVRTSWQTDFIDDVSDEIPELTLWFSLKLTCILLQTHSEENEEYSLAVQRQNVIKLSSVCKSANYYIFILQEPQAHALAHICVLNGPKVQR